MNFQFGKTLRTSKDARVVLADPEQAETCSVRTGGVLRISRRLSAKGGISLLEHLFPVVAVDSQRSNEPVTAPKMKDALQQHLRAAGFVPDHFTVHSFRVGGSLRHILWLEPRVDEIMKIGGWKTHKMTAHYIGQICGSGHEAATTQDVEVAYQAADAALAAAESQALYAACRKPHASKTRKAERSLGG